MKQKERKRVLHVITRLDRGGSAENTLLTVAGSDQSRFAITLAHGLTQGRRSDTEERAKSRGVDFIKIIPLVRDIVPPKDVLALFSLQRLMRKGGFQIVHTHTSKGGLLGRIAAYLAGVPIVVHTPHGHVFYGYYGAILSRVFIWLERWAARFTDRIIVLTAADAEDHVRFGIAAPEKFSVIHSGIDFSPFEKAGRQCRETRLALGLDPNGLVVGTLGRLTAIKGQDDLLRAFVRLQKQLENVWLLLVGDGEERGNLEHLAERLGVAERVVFAGWRDDIQALLRTMDIFAFPSLNEGMGKALVEAMYVGLPSVATAVGGVPELIEHGVEGLLVPARHPEKLASALEELARDEEKRQTFGAAARQRAQAYSVESMIEKIEVLYDSLLEEKKIAATQKFS